MILLLSSLAYGETQGLHSLHRDLSLRDGALRCEKLQQRYPELQKHLQALISSDIKPSYVPIRAANCLLELYPQDLETYQVWMEKKETLGLATLTVSKLDSLPIDISIPLTHAALEGENSSKLLPKLQTVLSGDIQQVVSAHAREASEIEVTK